MRMSSCKTLAVLPAFCGISSSGAPPFFFGDFRLFLILLTLDCCFLMVKAFSRSNSSRPLEEEGGGWGGMSVVDRSFVCLIDALDALVGRSVGRSVGRLVGWSAR